MNKKTELLLPAGDLQKAKIALLYGADAIFLGAKLFSLRARASNFSYEQIDEIIKFAHSLNKKVYIVANIICHNSQLKLLDEYLEIINKLNPDGFIVADPSIVNKLKNIYPNANIHISTQQSITNSKAALFWKRNNATRIILARELTIDEIELISNNLKNIIELEVFVHGAVCISFSGQCMMSNNFSLRDANIGGCAQSCRWSYTVQNPEIKNNSKFFTMSAKDMGQYSNIKKLVDLNIASLKIEGRMKSEHYVANVTKNYKLILDNLNDQKINEIVKKELLKSANREFDTAFLNGNPDYDKMLYHDTHKDLTQNYILLILEKLDNNYYHAIVKNNFNINSKIEIMTPTDMFETSIQDIINLKDNTKLINCPTPMMEIKIKFNTKKQIPVYSFARLI